MIFRKGSELNLRDCPRIMNVPELKSIKQIENYLSEIRRITKMFQVTLLDASEALVRYLQDFKEKYPNLTVVIEEGQVGNGVYYQLFGEKQKTFLEKVEKDQYCWYKSNWMKKNFVKSPVVSGKLIKSAELWKLYVSEKNRLTV